MWGHRAEREVLRGHTNEATQGQCGLPELMTKSARRAKTAVTEESRTLANSVGGERVRSG